MKQFKMVIISFLIGFPLLTCIAFLLLVEFLLTPYRQPTQHTPSQWNFAYRDITLTTQDGVMISGWYIPGPRLEAMLLVHGIHANREAMSAEAYNLHLAGYPVVMIDLRGHGDSGYSHLTYGYKEAYDVTAAIDYMSGLPEIKQIGVMGHSLGGAAVVRAVAHDDRVKLLIIQSSYNSLNEGIDDAFNNFVPLPKWPFAPMITYFAELRTGLDVRQMDSARDLATMRPRPLLIIHGKQDPMFPIAHARRMFAAAPEPKYLWEVDNLVHLNVAIVYPQAFNEKVLLFLQEAFAH